VASPEASPEGAKINPPQILPLDGQSSILVFLAFLLPCFLGGVVLLLSHKH